MTRTKSSRVLKVLFAFVMVVSMLSSLVVPVMAADEYPTPYPDLKVTHTKSGYEWGALNSEKTEWGITVYGRSNTGGYQPNIKFTNVGTEEKVLSFDLTAEFGEGATNAYVQVATGGTGGTNLLYETSSFENRHIEISLAPQAMIRVVSKSSNGTDIPLTVTLTNLKFVADTSASTTFLVPENGTYTVDGMEITTETKLEKDASEGYNVVATPADGYQFYGWYEKNTDRVISTSASTTLTFDNDSIVSALFVPAVAPGEEIFGVEMENGYVPFVKFDDAASFATSMGRPQVTLMKDYTLTESIAIPNGVTLLVPFDDARTLYTTTIEATGQSTARVTPSAFRTLTIAPNITITIQNGGGLSLSSKISASGTGKNSAMGTPTGPDGRIAMENGSAIEVESGGSLYAYGYIFGSGSVHCATGATVYECFQIRNWRGGGASFGMVDSGVFPVSQYYVQNIEVPLTLDAGAKEITNSAVSAASMTIAAGVTFIGDGGMFQISNGSVTKTYIPEKDRLEISLNGSARLTSIVLQMQDLPIQLPGGGLDSSNFVLPINSNITVKCNSGSEVEIAQDLAMLPGSELIIEEGANVTLKADTDVFVYDRNEWIGKRFVTSSTENYVPVGYSATNGTSDKRSDADLVDAKIDVNGTLSLNGSMYTTLSGASVISSARTGSVVFASDAGQLTNTRQVTQSSDTTTNQDIPITSAKLQNGDESYVLTEEAVEGDVYPYSATEDRWIEPFHGITITFDANGGTGEMNAIQITEDEAADGVVLPENSFTRPGYEFVGWSEDPNCAVEDVWRYEGDTVYPAEEFETKNITFYAIWEKAVGTYTVTFDANGGEGTMEPQVITADVPTALKANAFTREGYNFIGWAESPNGVKVFEDGETITGEENLTLYALWQKDHYTLTFHSNFEPDQTVTQNVLLNEIATLRLNTFEREGYEFLGWAFDANATKRDLADGATIGFDEDTDLYAVWAKNTFTITFDANGGEGEMAPQTIVRDKSTPLSKNQFTRDGYDFIGWSTEPNGQIWFEDEDPILTDSVEDFTLYAQWQIKEYTITFKNYDGTELQTYKIEHGETPAYTGEITPARDATAQYTYTFAGWTPEIVPATADAIYTAVFTETVNKYTIKFVDEDGTELQSSEVEYGKTPVFNGEVPTKAADAQYTYTFAGWTPEVTEVTGDATYTATYTATVNKYTIKFVDEDGTELQSSEVEYGKTPVFNGEVPTKAATAQYTYMFAGWDPEITAVTGDATYKATYTATVNKYTIKFVNEDGTELQSSEVEYGTVPTYTGETPTKAKTAQYTYTFAGWTPEVTEVTGEATYTATYTATVNKYHVTWNNWDDTLLLGEDYDYGATPSYTGGTPTKAVGANETGEYTFAGWTPTIVAVTADATYTATYTYTGWRSDENGRQYLIEDVRQSGWMKLNDGNWYYFYPETGYAATGYAMVPYAPADTGHTYGPYEVDLTEEAGHPEYAELGYATNGEFVFDENGVFQLNQTGKIMKNGSEWWCQNGEILWHARLVTDGEYYYYGSAGGALKRSVTSYIGDTNGLLPAGTYTFDDQARIIMYNGIITLDDGKWYYENGRRTYKGLFEEPEGSETYYYAASDGRIICGQDYYVTKTNNLFKAGVYTFDAEGKMVLNGLYWKGEELWYYENGVKTGAGLIKVGDDYYYIKSNGAAVLDADYYITKTNGLMDKGVYHFNPDGKMVIPEAANKNGLIWEDGKLWYYEDNARTHAGLILVDGYYYYIKSNGQAVTNCDYFVSNTNDLMPRATHHFDENGRMTDVQSEKNGLILENGKLWYYVNGEKQHPGLIEINGDYYYICTTGYAVADCDYYISNTNGLMDKGSYPFSADGKMVVPEPDTRTGLFEENGELVYYKDGVKTHAGLIQIDGKYYYIKSNCTAVRNCDYYVYNTNGLVAVGTYHFNADGTMVP